MRKSTTGRSLVIHGIEQLELTTPQLVATSGPERFPRPWSISADGKTLLLVDPSNRGNPRIGVVELEQSDKVRSLPLDVKERLDDPSLSPDGRWMLYTQGTGTQVGEINFRPFPDVRQQRRPFAPGSQPVFSADGKEMFAFDGAGLSVASFQTSPSPRVGNLRRLFTGRYLYSGVGRAWDVDSKNDRFLMITAPEEKGEPEPTQVAVEVTLNWFEELRQRVPKR